jgi:A/G-specific adenine glycosylase
VSEIMLQQTQVATVIPYFDRFMQRFADVVALADASVDEVLHLWTALGYYARARNLHKAARRVRDEFGGVFPQTFDAIASLPGIGRSTAGAILALSLDQRHPILDGNVKRVLTRVFGIDGNPAERRIEQQLWQLADACTPAAGAATYTQAIMDLGATLCTRRRPACALCPLAAGCSARSTGRQHELPAPKPRKPRALRRTAARERGPLLRQRRRVGRGPQPLRVPRRVAVRRQRLGAAARSDPAARAPSPSPRGEHPAARSDPAACSDPAALHALVSANLKDLELPDWEFRTALHVRTDHIFCN